MSHSIHPESSQLSDTDIVDRIRAGDLALFEEVMRRHNQRLYRVVRAILKRDDEVDDAMQQAYVDAYLHLDQFAGRAQLSTWLTRIAIHEALGRRRRQRANEAAATEQEDLMPPDPHAPDPERLAYAGELRAMLERSIDALPESYRVVFVCRHIEGMSTDETAEVLGLGDEAVKSRLHRARAMLRRELLDLAGAATPDTFAFHRSRCDGVVEAVLRRLGGAVPNGASTS